MASVFRAPPFGRLAAVCCVFALLAGSTGCSMIGGTAVNEESALRENLAKQREVALAFIRDSPDVDTIEFTHEGNRPGIGASWSANAIVTVGGKNYKEILGLRLIIGDGLPSAPPDTVRGPVTVIYSDGTSEIVQ